MPVLVFTLVLSSDLLLFSSVLVQFFFRVKMVTRRQLFDVLYKKDDLGRSNRTEYLFNYLVGHYKIESDEDAMLKLKNINSKFCNAVYSKLDQCARKTNRFLEKNKEWLSVQFVFEQTPYNFRSSNFIFAAVPTTKIFEYIS